ncbi:unnamed protein product [Prorocentrum cordatum]|uniref:Acyltransferase n=1 Tax=Prorocentrum cordatum TaxID=2364126 RepID=A0ABN9SUD1_9DINO|nr:unnamed protein product [Polarella glacialis]
MAWPVSPWIAALLLVGYATYAGFRNRVRMHAERHGKRIGPKVVALTVQRILEWYSRLVGVRLASQSGEGLKNIDPKRPYIITWHPHGAYSWSAIFSCSKFAVLGQPVGPEWFAVVAPVLFTIPFVSEALMLLNGRSCAKSVVEGFLRKGKTIGLQPGGIREQLATLHDQEQAIFPAKLGFIRLAIKYGHDLLPVYFFNENQLFWHSERAGSIARWLYRTTGAGLPFVAGRFGVPFGLPRKTDIHIRWGSPVRVGGPDPEPSDEKVEEVFAAYARELQGIFARHAFECLRPEVAERGLRIVRLDGGEVPPMPPMVMP